MLERERVLKQGTGRVFLPNHKKCGFKEIPTNVAVALRFATFRELFLSRGGVRTEVSWFVVSVNQQTYSVSAAFD